MQSGDVDTAIEKVNDLNPEVRCGNGCSTPARSQPVCMMQCIWCIHCAPTPTLVRLSRSWTGRWWTAASTIVSLGVTNPAQYSQRHLSPFPTRPPTPFVVVVQILETQKDLFFHLQQQRLIELIRKGETEAALEFAEEYLAPQGEENPVFLAELGECVNFCQWVVVVLWRIARHP